MGAVKARWDLHRVGEIDGMPVFAGDGLVMYPSGVQNERQRQLLQEFEIKMSETKMTCFGCGKEIEFRTSVCGSTERPYCSQSCLDKYGDARVTVDENRLPCDKVQGTMPQAIREACKARAVLHARMMTKDAINEILYERASIIEGSENDVLCGFCEKPIVRVGSAWAYDQVDQLRQFDQFCRKNHMTGHVYTQRAGDISTFVASCYWANCWMAVGSGASLLTALEVCTVNAKKLGDGIKWPDHGIWTAMKPIQFVGTTEQVERPLTVDESKKLATFRGFSRWTDRARKVMQLANQEAQRFNHEYIGTEHVLLGLVKEGSGVAAEVLMRLDIDLRKIRLEVEKVVQSGDTTSTGKLPLTPRTQKMVAKANEWSAKLNHNYTGTEHVLLGLIDVDEGVASQILVGMGVTAEKVRAGVLELLGKNREDAPFAEAGSTIIKATTGTTIKAMTGNSVDLRTFATKAQEGVSSLPGKYAYHEKVGNYERTVTFQTLEELEAHVAKERAK